MCKLKKGVKAIRVSQLSARWTPLDALWRSDSGLAADLEFTSEESI